MMQVVLPPPSTRSIVQMRESLLLAFARWSQRNSALNVMGMEKGPGSGGRQCIGEKEKQSSLSNSMTKPSNVRRVCGGKPTNNSVRYECGTQSNPGRCWVVATYVVTPANQQDGEEMGCGDVRITMA